MQSCSIISTYPYWTYMYAPFFAFLSRAIAYDHCRENKSNRNARTLSSSFAMLPKAHCYVRTLRREVWTSLKWTGLYSLTHRVSGLCIGDLTRNSHDTCGPDDPRDYIHRVGRTARAGKAGKSLMFLLESELGFLRYLKEARVPLNEFSFPADKIANVQTQVSPHCVLIKLLIHLQTTHSSRNCSRRTTIFIGQPWMAIAHISNPTLRTRSRRYLM